ncbi:hypothetical protein ACLOJK_005745 [Asimina triloba]
MYSFLGLILALLELSTACSSLLGFFSQSFSDQIDEHASHLKPTPKQGKIYLMRNICYANTFRALKREEPLILKDGDH